MAEEEDSLKVVMLKVAYHSAEAFREALSTDFSSLTSNQINSSHLLTGIYGIDGFITLIIDELLDMLPIEHANYKALMELLGPFCGKLAHKMSNYKKVCH